MPRYIDADKLVTVIKRNGILADGYSDEEREADVIDMVSSVPTADVAPVVHGRWIYKYPEKDIAYCEMFRTK